MYDYLVKFFWDRVLSAVFNSCGQIALTMDDMHLSSKSGQGVWQLIQGIQETSWSWLKFATQKKSTNFLNSEVPLQ